MVRKNGKKHFFSYDNTIKKSNDFSIAYLSHGLTLNQMQLLAYAIYCTQKNGNTEFIKADFEKQFNLKRYKTEDAYKDSEKVFALRYSTQNLEENKFTFSAIFTELQYDNGRFIIEWNPKFIPHILELKEHYVTTDLTITSKFKSSFSWTLYEYLKARYGAYYISISKVAILRLFGVENRKTYINSTAQFKRGVLDVAIHEINKHTELSVSYIEIKRGRSIVGFELKWSTGQMVPLATDNQVRELERLADEIFSLSDDVSQMTNDVNRDKAINLIRKSELTRKYQDGQLTLKQVEEQIPRLKSHLRQIELLVKNDENQTGNPVPFYNWLEERE